MKEIISKLNKLFESKVRLGIMSILLVNDKVDFNTLKDLLDITDGNLASHIKTLEKNQLILVKKQFVGRKPKTTYQSTEKGKTEFKKHLNYLEQLIKSNK